MCSVNTLLCINDIFHSRGHDQPSRTLAKQLRFNHQVFSCCMPYKQGRNQDFLGGTHTSPNALIPHPPPPRPMSQKGEITESRNALTVYSCFEKGVGRNAHATIPKGNMGYDQYTVRNDWSCRTYFCCFPLVVTNICPWPPVPFFQISLKNSALKATHNTFWDCRVHFRQPFSK